MVSLIFSSKNWRPFFRCSHRPLQSNDPLLAVVSSPLPPSDVVYPVIFFSKFSHKNILVGCYPWMVSPGAVRPFPPPLTPSDAIESTLFLRIRTATERERQTDGRRDRQREIPASSGVTSRILREQTPSRVNFISWRFDGRNRRSLWYQCTYTRTRRQTGRHIDRYVQIHVGCRQYDSGVYRVSVTRCGNWRCHPVFHFKKLTTFLVVALWWNQVTFFISSPLPPTSPSPFNECSLEIQPQKLFHSGVTHPPGWCHPGRSAPLPLVTPLCVCLYVCLSVCLSLYITIIVINQSSWSFLMVGRVTCIKNFTTLELVRWLMRHVMVKHWRHHIFVYM